ncbi:MAG: PDZ domain-containing protein [Calditrichaeota bacterium]|nr:PDZ domain-containing protein [Calditrichota bacterium]
MKKLSISVLLLGIFLGGIFSLYGANLAEVDEPQKIGDGEKFSLGVAIRNLKPELKEKTGLSGGALIVDVLENSKAEKVGLRKDDIITRFDGQEITSASQLNELISDLEEEREVTLEVYREGSVKKFQASLKPRKPKEIRVMFDGQDMDIDLPDLENLPHMVLKKMHPFMRNGAYLGVRTENLTSQLQDYFGVEHGVLIQEVLEDSPAEKAGLKAGDIITAIGDRKIEDYADLIRTVDYYNPGEEIKLFYNRRGKSNSTKIVLEDKKTFSRHMNWFDGEHVIELPDIKIEEEKLKDIEKKLKEIKIDIEMYII